MTTPIETTRSKLPGDMAHMMPAQSTDPKEYRQVQRRKKDNVPCDLIGNAAWYEDARQPEPGYIIWRADKKGQQVIAHIEYIETEDAWFGLHYVKGIPYATLGSKIDEGKYGLKRKGGKTIRDTDDPPNPRKPPRHPRRSGSHNTKNGCDTRPKPTNGRRRYFAVLHPRVRRPNPDKHGRSTGSDRRRRRNESH